MAAITGVSIAMSGVQAVDSGWSIFNRMLPGPSSMEEQFKLGYEKLDTVIIILAEHDDEELPFSDRQLILNQHDRAKDKLDDKRSVLASFWRRNDPRIRWAVVTCVQQCELVLDLAKRTSSSIKRRAQDHPRSRNITQGVNCQQALLHRPMNHYCSCQCPGQKALDKTSAVEVLKLRNAVSKWYRRASIIAIPNKHPESHMETLKRMVNIIDSAGADTHPLNSQENRSQLEKAFKSSPSFERLIDMTVLQLLPEGMKDEDDISLRDLSLSSVRPDPDVQNPFEEPQLEADSSN